MAKSRQAKAKEVSPETKLKVLQRQNGKSISGAYLFPYKTEFHHLITRGSGGVGYEWNIVALTSEEHRAVHDRQPIQIYGRLRFTCEEFQALMRNHMKTHYTGWSERKCRYVKGWEEEDYEVKRSNKRLPDSEYFRSK